MSAVAGGRPYYPVPLCFEKLSTPSPVLDLFGRYSVALLGSIRTMRSADEGAFEVRGRKG